MAQPKFNLAELRLKDYDKYLICKFAPPEKQEQLAAIFNFYHEISQIPLEVSEPMIGLIKIQWWKDVLDEAKNGNPPRPHPILLELVKTEIDYDALNSTLHEFANIIEGDTPKTLTELEIFLNNSVVKIFCYAAKTLGVEANRDLYLAYALAKTANKLPKNLELVASQLHEKAKSLIEDKADSNSLILKLCKNYLQSKSRNRILLTLLFNKPILL